MKSGALANACLEVCLDAQRRIIGVGDKSYASEHGIPWGNEGGTLEVGKQRFEDETLQDNLQGLEEELLDAINWAAMAVLKIRAAREKAGQ